MIKETINQSDLFLFKSITNVNHNPHPYTIGPKHIDYASKHHNGILGTETCENVPCAVPGCSIHYDGHTSDKVLFLQLKRNASKDEVQAFLTNLKPELLKEKVDGIAFVETNEKFRIK